MSSRRRLGRRASSSGEERTPLDLALRLLARRPRTEAEIREALRQRGVAPPEVHRTMRRLEERGWLDDRTLAEHFITTRAARLGHGKRRLLMDLARRGVASAVAEGAWAEAVRRGEVDPRESARRAAARAVARRGGRLDGRGYARVYNALLRQGFDVDTVESVLESHRPEADSRRENGDDVP